MVASRYKFRRLKLKNQKERKFSMHINGVQLYNSNYNKHIKMSANRKNNGTKHSNEMKRMSLAEKAICGVTITFMTLFIIFGLLKIFRKPPSI